MNKKFIDNLDIDYSNKNILLRADFNIPIKDEIIQDDKRIISTFPTIKFLIDQKINNLVIISHLGRPKGKKVNKLSLKIVHTYLQHKLPKIKLLFSDLENAKKTIENNKNCIILLENIRFYPEEENKAPIEKIVLFQKKISNLADIYVNDAFGTSHRAHCSIIAKGYLIKLGGFLIKKELQKINNVITEPARPFTCILGGAKVSDKIKLIYNLIEKVDDIIIGGGMAFTFLKVIENMEIGKSLYDEESAKEIPKIMEKAKKNKVNIHFPIDFVGSKEFNNIKSKVLNTRFIPKNYMGLDIGMKSVIYFSEIISRSKTILWNGPMGVFEFSKFSDGSKRIVDEIEKISEINNIKTVIGGGDTANCYQKFAVKKFFVHISTGGGATLELLEGIVLPGIETLNNLI